MHIMHLTSAVVADPDDGKSQSAHSEQCQKHSLKQRHLRTPKLNTAMPKGDRMNKCLISGEPIWSQTSLFLCE
jgi:hypothetical protein